MASSIRAARDRRAPHRARLDKRRESGLAIVRQTLQGYADRGVFRGFGERTERGRHVFRFSWLTARPLQLVYEPRTATLTLPNLLPHVGRGSALHAELAGAIAEKTDRALPGHRRIDPRRAAIAWSMARGHVTISLKIRGSHHEYAVRKAVNLVNELFVLLHASYTDYLGEQFGVSQE